MDKASSISETPLFRGPENDPIPLKEQKKIQIDIRRPIRPGKAASGPIQRSIKDPHKLTLPRGEKEGRKCLFDRDEIKNWRRKSGIPSSTGSSKASQQEEALRNTPKEEVRKRDDLRDRLGEQTEPHRGRKSSVHSRLGMRPLLKSPPALERQELERFRPDVKPWDVNPEFVPRGRNYYEHDTREESLRLAHRVGGGPMFSKARDRGKGGVGRPRPYEHRNGGNSSFRRHRRDHSDAMEWKHDRYPGEGEFHR